MENFSKLSAKERKVYIQKIVSECYRIAYDHIRTWQPVDPSWPTEEGCGYLRLSSFEQVAVEKGSLEQQIWIIIAEVISRSRQDKINYRIVKFFIEPGISGTHDQRPQFLLMIGEIESGKHRFVVVKELSRIARHLGIVKKFTTTCHTVNCQIFLRGFPLNLNDPTQLLQLDILAAFGEYESNVNSKRVRESCYSAMVSSGKFNSTHQVLGLDQMVDNGEAKVGFYVPNDPELETVTWIMKTFTRVGSFTKTLAECDRLGVKNKNGRAFKTNSLNTLLTNRKYIGEWEMNPKNKDKNQDKLLPYERHHIAKLNHGPVIDLDLWNEVQATIARIAGTKQKATGIKGAFPLSGILRFEDGTPFHGTGSWGRTTRVAYYYNPKNKVRLSCDAVHAETRQRVAEIIANAPGCKEAIRKRAEQANIAIEMLEQEAAKITAELGDLEDERKNLDRRLDFLLGGTAAADAERFRRDYVEGVARIDSATAEYKSRLSALGARKAQVAESGVDWKNMEKLAARVQKLAEEQDPIALRNAYRILFEKVVVGQLDSTGVRTLKFVLRGDSSSVTGEEESSVDIKMAGATPNQRFHVLAARFFLL